MMEGSPKSPCRLQRPLRKFGRGLKKLKNKFNEKVGDLKREYGCCEYVKLQDDDSVSAEPPTNFYNGQEGYPVPAPPTFSYNGFGEFSTPAPPTFSYNGFGEFPTPAPPTFSYNGFGEFPTPAPPTSSHNGLGEFPMPAPPTISPNGLGQFPMPASPFGWWPPAGQNDHEASGSNHPSHQNSDYIDADNFDVPAYLRDHQIPDHGALWTRPTLSDQVAGLLDGLHVSTPTGRAPSVFLDTDEFLPTDTVSPEQPQQEPFSPGAISVEELQQELESSSGPISMDQSWQTAVTGHTPSSSVYPGSMMTDNTVASKESLMDTGASGYVLPPVPEDRPSSGRLFHDFYWDCRRIVRGETGPGRSSGRRGRKFRVLTHIACTLIRRVKKVRGTCRRVRKRSSLYICHYQTSPTTGLGRYHLGSPSAGVVQLQNRGSLKLRCTKRLRTEGPRAQPRKEQCNNYSSRYKGVKPRNAKWKVEIRVSMTKADKVWLTYDTEVEAALAYDAGMYHCSEKRKRYNFPMFIDNLGESLYPVVLEYCKNGRCEETKQLVKELADAHAANFRGRMWY